MAGRSVIVRSAVLVAACGGLLVAARQGANGGRVLDAEMHHLGNDKTPDWKEAPEEPTAPPLEVTFDSHANTSEWLLDVGARDVDNQWALELNDVEFARLRKVNDELRVGRYPVPPGLVKAGRNTLRVRAVDQPQDDITVGRFVLHEQSLRELARLGRVAVTVVDAATKRPIPARITVVDAAGAPLELYYAERPLAAVRPGIAYSGDGGAVLEVPAGPCTLWASRGMEWSAAKVELDVEYGAERRVVLALAREVETTGWIAADTHVHTLTYSGHGDASVEERLVTLAGEGIELAIATDHNHHTDYRPLQAELALTPWFTPVVGNEVTTDNGHMNAFPLDPATPVPESKETDWKKLVAGIRAKGAKVVILNHPRWPEGGKDPLTNFGFDDATGLNTAGQEFTFDCIELVNSDCPTAPPSLVFPMWYALLERGQRFTAIGSSDSHAVGVIVGQGRTYVPSATDDPMKIDVDAACGAFLRGEVAVSLGMFATIEVDGHRMGETFRASGDEVEAVVTVRHPSWVSPRTLEFVVDREVTALVRLDEPAPGDTPTTAVRRARLKLPRESNWIVAVARGDRVDAPFWRMELPETLAITNPVFVTR